MATKKKQRKPEDIAADEVMRALTRFQTYDTDGVVKVLASAAARWGVERQLAKRLSGQDVPAMFERLFAQATAAPPVAYAAIETRYDGGRR